MPKFWSEQNLAAFLAVAAEPLQRALVLALETGQRQGDLLVLPWSAYDGTWIRLRQGKTRRQVNNPAARRPRDLLGNTNRAAPGVPTDHYALRGAANTLRQ